MVGNITFLMIFAVFNPSPLTQWINCNINFYKIPFLQQMDTSDMGPGALSRTVRTLGAPD